MHMIWIALVVSLDSLNVGITYGLRKVHISFFSMLILSALSAITILVAMSLGEWLTQWISPAVTSMLGGMIFIILGVFTLWQKQSPASENSTNPCIETRTLTDTTKPFSSIIQIIRSPLHADLDHSASISPFEAFFLGTAISLDAFAVGIGASTLAISPIITAGIVSIMTAGFLSLGMWVGKQWKGSSQNRLFVYIPGISLILLGFFRLF